MNSMRSIYAQDILNNAAIDGMRAILDNPDNAALYRKVIIRVREKTYDGSKVYEVYKGQGWGVDADREAAYDMWEYAQEAISVMKTCRGQVWLDVVDGYLTLHSRPGASDIKIKIEDK